MDENDEGSMSANEFFRRPKPVAVPADNHRSTGGGMLSPSVPAHKRQRVVPESLTLDETSSDCPSSSIPDSSAAFEDADDQSTMNERSTSKAKGKSTKRKQHDHPLAAPQPRQPRATNKMVSVSDSDDDELPLGSQIERAVAKRQGLIIPNRNRPSMTASTSKTTLDVPRPPPRKKVARPSDKTASSSGSSLPQRRQSGSPVSALARPSTVAVLARKELTPEAEEAPGPVVDFWNLDAEPVRKVNKTKHVHGQATRTLAQISAAGKSAASYDAMNEDADDEIVASSLEVAAHRYERTEVVEKRKKAEQLQRLRERRQAKSTGAMPQKGGSGSSATTSLDTFLAGPKKQCVYCCEMFDAGVLDRHAETCFEELQKQQMDPDVAMADQNLNEEAAAHQEQLLAELAFSSPEPPSPPKKKQATTATSTRTAKGKQRAAAAAQPPLIVLSDEFPLDDDIDYEQFDEAPQLVVAPVTVRQAVRPNQHQYQYQNQNQRKQKQAGSAAGAQPDSSPPQGSIYISTLRADLYDGIQSLYAPKGQEGDGEPLDGLAPQTMTTATRGGSSGGGGGRGRGRGGGGGKKSFNPWRGRGGFRRRK